MYRRRGGDLEVFLAHPGGPYFARKDAGVWSIPKGEPAAGEDLLAAAIREFAEETGIEPGGEMIPLGSVRQRGGKTVHAWAFASSLPGGAAIRSNTFTMEWPPGSGRLREFPEIDRAAFFPLDAARSRINPAQAEFLERLVKHLGP
jgi:predicted NUDIX family NTP pyrophosphohydrolase